MEDPDLDSTLEKVSEFLANTANRNQATFTAMEHILDVVEQRPSNWATLIGNILKDWSATMHEHQ